MLLTERTRLVHVMNPVAAGQSNQTSSAVDMSQNGGYRGCRFIADIGALTASQVTSMKVQGSPDNVDWTTLGGDLAKTGSGNMADADSNKMLVCDVYRPVHRYLRAIVLRGTANAVIDCVIAELYEPITEPTLADTTVSKQSMTISPPLGTA
jgi:hypothetical protein